MTMGRPKGSSKHDLRPAGRSHKAKPYTGGWCYLCDEPHRYAYPCEQLQDYQSWLR